MTPTLYELAGRDGHRFSPYCWRTLMALKHKGLAFERVAMKFTDRACIAASGQDRVPAYADYILFGTFMWPRCSSPVRLLEADDPLASWRRRMLGLFDGFAAAAPGYEV